MNFAIRVALCLSAICCLVSLHLALYPPFLVPSANNNNDDGIFYQDGPIHIHIHTTGGIKNGGSLVASTKPFRTLPKSQTNRTWDCRAIPGYKRLCPEDSDDDQTLTKDTKITLEALLTPPTKIPVWKRPQNVTRALHDLVQRVFQPFPIITASDLEALMYEESCDEPLKFKITNGTVYVAIPDKRNPRKIRLENRHFTATRRLHPLRNLQTMVSLGMLNHIQHTEAVICIGDTPPNGPGFSLVWNTQYQGMNDPYNVNTTGIPMPLMEFLSPLDKWDAKLKDTFQWRHKYRWENRTRKALFRGDIRTCHPLQGDELAREVDYEVPCGRKGLKKVAQHFPNTMDVALEEKFIPMPDQENFTMILLAEGHYGWANRMATQLAMESVVIRQFNNPYDEWYNAWLEPFVHYVPVDHLWNYLPGVVQWCLDHDDMIHQISRNADEYAKTFLPVDTQLQLIKAVMEEYERRFIPDPPNTIRGEEQKWVSLEDLEQISVEKNFFQGKDFERDGPWGTMEDLERVFLLLARDDTEDIESSWHRHVQQAIGIKKQI